MKTTEEKIEVMKAFVQGRPIEYSFDGETDWSLIKDPDWDWSEFDYRIASETMMTNRQLAELLAKGYGQAQYSNGSYIWTAWNYSPDDEDDEQVDEHTVVRRWGERDWRKATVDIYRDFLK